MRLLAGRTGNWSRDPPRRNGRDGAGVAAAGEAALTTKPTAGDLESDRLKARLETALIERDLLLRGSPPWRPTAL